MKKQVRRNSKQRGATLYEFAAILPILLFLMIGIIDFGRAMYAYHFVSGAARAATRWASVRGASCNSKYITPCPAAGSDINTYVRTLSPPGMYLNPTSGCATTVVGCLTINCPTCVNTMTNFIWPGTTTTGGVAGSDCTISGADPPNTPGCVVQVQVEYTFSFGIPIFKFGNLILSSTSEMVISQ